MPIILNENIYYEISIYLENSLLSIVYISVLDFFIGDWVNIIVSGLCSVEIGCGSIPDRAIPETIKLVFVAFLLNIQH
jgi:hypothetical protein